jgi:hypothetical protein
MAVACEALKQVLANRVQDLVRDSMGFPILSSKSCDGTPISTACQIRTTLPCGKSTTVKGRKGKEFLVSNQFFRSRTPIGEWRDAVLLAEAIPLAQKSHLAILGAARKSWVTLRSLGHRGCSVEHYVWDRAGFSALERQTRLWHQAQKVPDPPVGVSPEVMGLLEFIVITPCSLHDAQNGFRWGLFSSCRDAQLMRDLYITVEALRNSIDLLSSRLAGWIASCLTFVDSRDVQWLDQRRSLLEALAVDPEVAEALLELQLVWDGRNLMMHREAQVELRVKYGGNLMVRGCGVGDEVGSHWGGNGESDLEVCHRLAVMILCRRS